MTNAHTLCEYPSCNNKATDILIFNGKTSSITDYCSNHLKNKLSAINTDGFIDEDTGECLYLCQLCNIGLDENDFHFQNAKCKDCQPKIKMEQYSPKSFVLIGDTKPYKEQIKKLGGKFNPNLKCGVGWIFSNNRTEKVKAFIQTIA
jgi:hypothetical protein